MERPPSAELRPDQLDSDSLPPQAVLDQILKRFVGDDCSPQQIINSGIADRDTVLRVCTQIIANEYKHRQAPTGNTYQQPGLRSRVAIRSVRGGEGGFYNCCQPPFAVIVATGTARK